MYPRIYVPTRSIDGIEMAWGGGIRHQPQEETQKLPP